MQKDCSYRLTFALQLQMDCPMSLKSFTRSLAPHRLLGLILGLAAVQTSSAQSLGNNREQFEAQKKGRYVYTPFTAMASPVVLPMDGKLSAADWLTGLDVSLGGVLFPHIHVDTAIGTSTTDQENLAVGHHDPNTNGFTWQNIEFGLSGRFNEYFEAFGTYAATVSADGDWEAKYEEWFAKLQNLDAGWLGGFEVRGGRIYNRFGIQNTYHPHGFDWADQYLVNARTLGEDSLTIIGADVTWKLPVPWTSQLDVAVGVAPDPHDHAHGETRSIEGAMFEAEGAVFDDVMTVANWTNIYNYNDFHQYRAGVSGAWGDNQYGRGTQVYGAHFEYQWRERGFEPGGRYLRWRTEVMWREWGAQSVTTVTITNTNMRTMTNTVRSITMSMSTITMSMRNMAITMRSMRITMSMGSTRTTTTMLMRTELSAAPISGTLVSTPACCTASMIASKPVCELNT